ncbi:uroporphyrinogen-III synthase, partial [Xanthomonas oryzae pv. oryzae]
MAALSHNHTMTGLAHPDAAWTLISLRP